MTLRKIWYTLVQVGYDLFLKLNPRKLGAHAVITDDQGRVLLLRSRFADVWMLPGGGLDSREHVDAGVLRECREELGAEVAIQAFTGFYYFEPSSAYVAIFRCRLDGPVRLSHEHAELRWAELAAVPASLRPMVTDALSHDGSTAVRRIP